MRKDININFQSHRTYNLLRILMNKLIQKIHKLWSFIKFDFDWHNYQFIEGNRFRNNQNLTHFS